MFSVVEENQKEDFLKELRYWFQAILDQLYGSEEFNGDTLETYLEEMSHLIQMRVPAGTLAVGKVSKEEMNYSGLLNTWIKVNNNYLKSLAV